MRSSTKRNRGVVLLIVLSLLVLFTILAVTFVVVAATYRDGAVGASRYRRVGDDPRKLLDSAAYALMRGTLDENSPFRGHELLRDMYGIEGFTGFVNAATFRAGNQLIDVTINSVQDLTGSSLSLNDDTGFYNGCVMTFVGGEAGGVSTRIVGYAGSSKTFRIVAPYVDGATKATLSNGDRVVVNGRPFNGTGVGYNSTKATSSASTPLLDRTVTIGGMSVPVALLPNLAGHSSDTAYVNGDTDESYDAADFQNIALAAVIPTSSDPNIPSILPSFHRPALINYLYVQEISPYLTSVNAANNLQVFLQPYGPDNTVGTADDPQDTGGTALSSTVLNNVVALKQAMIFRPLPELNPDFDGGNPDFTSSGLAAAIAAGTNPYVIGGWDVDTDGDGYTDGVWINPGFPLQTTEDGRLARPLVSVLVVDMDGKINLNTDGNWAHIAGTVTSTGPHPVRTRVTTSDLARTPASDTRPRGQGYGPPEINPTVGTSSSSSDRLFEPAELEKLLLGISSRPGRYAADKVPGASGLDTLAARKFYDISADFSDNTTANLRAFQTMPDLRGELAIGLDHAGQPRWDQPRWSGSDVRDNNPYEVNLATNGPNGVNAAGASDTPFTPSELERILRNNDVDAELLPDRLAELFSVFTTDSDAPQNRRLVTTDSYDVPVPHVYYPNPALAPSSVSRPEHVTDLIRRRVKYYIDNDAATSTLTVAQRTTLTNRVIQTSSFLSPDLVLGTKMDINRPFGDSRDNNGNGVVDEHWQTGTNEATGNNESIDGAFVDHDNDGVTNENGFLARQYFARHLYQLMMMLAPTNGIDLDSNGTVTAAETTATSEMLAQWVINVVDFRDPDAIMTPFEYDTKPFSPPQPGPDGGWGVAGMDDDGDLTMDNESEALWPGSDDIRPWSVDGYLGTGPSGASDDATPERALVWGCERPELLITETTSMHDRRSEDLVVPNELTTRTDVGGNLIGETDFENGTGSALNDFDQRLKPRGYVYVEIFNPWSSKVSGEHKPRELYTANSNSGGINLNRTAGTTPVWRLAFTAEPAGTAKADLDPPTGTPPTIERLVYFTNSTTAPGTSDGTSATATVHYSATTPARILGGRYAVVGTYHERIDEPHPISSATAAPAEYVALIGRRSTNITDKTTTRRVVMHPHTTPDNNWFFVEENGVAQGTWMDASLSTNYVANMQPTVAIPVLDLNISEVAYPVDDPDGNPYATSTAVHPATGEKIYETAFDVPFDNARLDDGTVTEYRRVHLQRLANPLEAYDATTNPYRTVDSLEVDLTVFNGMSNGNDPEAVDGDPDFASRERGDSTTPPNRIVWSDDNVAPGDPGRTTTPGIANHYFNESFVHTLGGLNSVYGVRYQKEMNPGVMPLPAGTTAPSDEFVGVPHTSSANGESFPWFTWNNRPFVSELELLLVPKARSSQLLQQFGVIDPPPPALPDDPYAGSTWHYGHLLNFFDNRTGSDGAHFYRVLEFLHVPSRFIGTETWLNKTTFASGVGTNNFHPPFNRIPAFREPGKLNPNSIYDDRTWRALTGLNDPIDFATPDEATWSDSRRGYAGSGIIDVDDAYPTIFANPLRGSGAGRLVPLATMVRADIDCTLLRSDTIDPSAPPTSGQPNFATTSGGSHINPTRNPYFRYRSIQRLSNLVTSRSNVYAVWITIGLFEVNPVTGGLGQEIGSETGEVQRHRAFYMIDRSIPAAYEPGENHNVDRAILVRRFIE